MLCENVKTIPGAFWSPKLFRGPLRGSGDPAQREPWPWSAVCAGQKEFLFSSPRSKPIESPGWFLGTGVLVINCLQFSHPIGKDTERPQEQKRAIYNSSYMHNHSINTGIKWA